MVNEYDQAIHLAKISERLNKKLLKNIKHVAKYAEYEKGDADKIMSDLVRTCRTMDELSIEHIAMVDIYGYDILEQGCTVSRRRRQLRR